MPGVRLQHPTARNVRFTISEPDHPYPSGPYQCTAPEFGGCGQVHVFKTHHLNVDETGSTIVGDVLFEMAKAHLLAHGFTVANTVDKPPTIGIGLGPRVNGTGQWGNIPIVRGDDGG
jgi:hypothetical protein